MIVSWTLAKIGTGPGNHIGLDFLVRIPDQNQNQKYGPKIRTGTKRTKFVMKNREHGQTNSVGKIGHQKFRNSGKIFGSKNCI